MSILTRLMAPIAALGVIAGCVAPPPPKADLDLQATFLKYAGPPIDSFTYLGRYTGFRTLGDKDVVIWTTINDAYLIRVKDPCYGLHYVDRVGFTFEQRTVNRTFDKVIVGQQHCLIDSIRHIDYGAMKRDRLAGV